MARAFGPGRQTKGGVPGVCRMGAEHEVSDIWFLITEYRFFLYP